MKTTITPFLGSSIIAIGLTLTSSLLSPVVALPNLQLDIFQGTYDSVDQTVVTSNKQFTLYAYCLLNNPDACTKKYYISIAVTPKGTSTGTDFGNFKIGSTTYTSNQLTFGTPPLADLDAGASDPGDLSSHGIFPTLFTEYEFTFNKSLTRKGINVQDNPGMPLNFSTSKENLTYFSFNFDVSGLKDNYNLHFDLYDVDFKQTCDRIKGLNQNCKITDVDINSFAPFSHDAGTIARNNNDGGPSDFNPLEIPEPSLLTGLITIAGIGGLLRYRKSNPCQ